MCEALGVEDSDEVPVTETEAVMVRVSVADGVLVSETEAVLEVDVVPVVVGVGQASQLSQSFVIVILFGISNLVRLKSKGLHGFSVSWYPGALCGDHLAKISPEFVSLLFIL